MPITLLRPRRHGRERRDRDRARVRREDRAGRQHLVGARKSASFASASSVIASIIRSAGDELVGRRRRARASRRDRRRPSRRASSRLFRIAPSPRSTAPGYGSCSDTRRPEAATTCAIPPPICPAPTTSTCSNSIGGEPTIRFCKFAAQPPATLPASRASRSAGGRRPTATCSRRTSSTAAGSSSRRDGASESGVRPQGWITFVAERDHTDRRLRRARAEPRPPRARRAVRDLRRSGRLVERCRPRAHRPGRAGAGRELPARRRSGCSRRTSAPAGSTSSPAGCPTARARRRSAGASRRPRSATANS